MKKRWSWLLVGLLLLALPAVAEEARTLEVTYYDNEDVNVGMMVQDAIVLENGNILFCGSMLHRDSRIELAMNIGFETTPNRTDAFVMVLSDTGNMLWERRQGDPQSVNSFNCVWQLPDGRYLLRLRGVYGTAGTQYQIVAANGQLDETLPVKVLRELDVLPSLVPVEGGYFAGGFWDSDGALAPMRQGDGFTFLDESLAVQWTLTDESFYRASFYEGMLEMADGFVLGGSVERIDLGAGIPCVIKISREGELLWQYMAHGDAYAYPYDIAETADGGLLVCTSHDPRVATPVDQPNEPTLYKLSANGEFEWMQQYSDTMGEGYIEGIAPLNDGYVLVMTQTSGRQIALLYVDAQGELRGSALLPTERPEDESVMYWQSCKLAPAGEDRLLVYGYEDWGEEPDYAYREDMPPQRMYYTFISAEDFAAP